MGTWNLKWLWSPHVAWCQTIDPGNLQVACKRSAKNESKHNHTRIYIGTTFDWPPGCPRLGTKLHGHWCSKSFFIGERWHWQFGYKNNLDKCCNVSRRWIKYGLEWYSTQSYCINYMKYKRIQCMTYDVECGASIRSVLLSWKGSCLRQASHKKSQGKSQFVSWICPPPSGETMILIPSFTWLIPHVFPAKLNGQDSWKKETCLTWGQLTCKFTGCKCMLQLLRVLLKFSNQYPFAEAISWHFLRHVPFQCEIQKRLSFLAKETRVHYLPKKENSVLYSSLLYSSFKSSEQFAKLRGQRPWHTFNFNAAVGTSRKTIDWISDVCLLHSVNMKNLPHRHENTNSWWSHLDEVGLFDATH